ncbi:MAG: class I SAM-dependent methyltransferase [Chlamydiales bacterium]
MDTQKQWVKTIFDSAAPEYGKAGCSFFQHFGKNLVQFSQVSPGDRVLDVATGKGAVLFPLIDRVGPKGSVIGIDLSSNMVFETQKQLKDANKSWASVEQMDAEQLAFSDGSFDFVFCGFALPFFSSLNTALSEFKRVLKRGGYLVVSTFGKRPELLSWMVEESKKLGVDRSLTTTSLRERGVLDKLLEEAGFSNIEFFEEQKVFWHESSQAWWKSLWSHAGRSIMESLSPSQLESLSKQALLKAETLRDNKGIPQELHAIFGKAQKS